MTNRKLLSLAYGGALRLWDIAKEKLEKDPNNSTLKERELEAWKTFVEVRNLLLEAETNSDEDEEESEN